MSTNTRSCGSWWVLAAAFLLAMSGPALAQRGGPGGGGAHMGGGFGGARGVGGGLRGGPNQHFDARFSHNQYYYNRGYSVRTAPAGGREFHGPNGGRYWYRGGNWYRWNGGAWVVWGAPYGLFVPFLPPYYTTIWWGGVPYYYANDTYYTWDDSQQGYEVVQPPAGIESQATTQPPASDQLYAYPKNGQSDAQQQQDRYECHRWAVGQTGFDPTVAAGGVPEDQVAQKRDQYFRADVACLQGRGYTVD